MEQGELAVEDDYLYITTSSGDAGESEESPGESEESPGEPSLRLDMSPP
jgi:hypothetical protein